MPKEPCCEGCMEDRAVGGMTYKRVDVDLWDVVYEGRPTDTTVMRAVGLGDVAWLVFELRWSDGSGGGEVDVYGYSTLRDFELAYIARAGRERNGGGEGSPTADTGGDLFPT